MTIISLFVFHLISHHLLGLTSKGPYLSINGHKQHIDLTGHWGTTDGLPRFFSIHMQLVASASAEKGYWPAVAQHTKADWTTEIWQNHAKG